MNKILVYDIETILSYFLVCIYIPDEGWVVFSISEKKNDLYKLIKFIDENRDKLWVGYNNLNFDGQVMEYIYRNYESWAELSSLEIAYKIWEFSQKLIDDMKYGLFPPYREWECICKPLDVFKVQHFDNKNRRVGLKRVEYEMDAVNIEEMKCKHYKESFTESEEKDLIYYCKNDVWETYRNYLYLIGETTHKLYEGNNQIEIRQALSEEFKINCLNFSNSKYGDEIIKLLYCKESGINYNDLPKKGTFRKTLYFKYGIPSFIKFSTPVLSNFLQKIRSKEIDVNDKFEESVAFNNQVYTFALGGLHNEIENKKYDANEEYTIIDADVTAYYVATILNNEYCPAHLKKKYFIPAYRWIYNERSRLKPLAKTSNKIKGIVSGYKEAGVTVYGKMGDMTNWMYDPQARLNTCIAGELSILMLIEAQELSGNKCIMANTDGATFYVKRTEVENFYKVCNEWATKTNYNLEFAEFKKLYFLSVNHYIGEKIDGEVKAKGDFLLYTELHKAKSFRVIRLALKAYFIDNIPVEKFINEFDNIFDFCARDSAGEKFTHKLIKKNKQIELPKVLRYYVAKKGWNIMRVVNKGVDTNANDTNVEPAEYLKRPCNNLPERIHKAHLQNVNRQWYIDKANEVIFRIERGRKPKAINNNINQISLF